MRAGDHQRIVAGAERKFAGVAKEGETVGRHIDGIEQPRFAGEIVKRQHRIALRAVGRFAEIEKHGQPLLASGLDAKHAGAENARCFWWRAVIVGTGNVPHLDRRGADIVVALRRQIRNDHPDEIGIGRAGVAIDGFAEVRAGRVLGAGRAAQQWQQQQAGKDEPMQKSRHA
ncbi:hypothetical protein [Mesorhizobium sp. M8A.F.Ca.ET.207.01.1.1]|uniref:hypothetical protein n=1 Tax=Mesorhizobium sp. M8A.F.Ca.ET.207.01.1.1 TaxID=2563968 RepID=UPI00167802F1|nr:hypothetical protein [Mesorhizobium sp. M8A.F.Ca.ET.207.01.1.1]